MLGKSLILIPALLALAAPASASPLRVTRVPVAAGAHTTWRSQSPITRNLDMQLTSVRVNGVALVVGDQLSKDTSYMYGEGVVVRISDLGGYFSLRVASLRKVRVVVAVRYRLVKAPQL